jgi:hypothetical protein
MIQPMRRSTVIALPFLLVVAWVAMAQSARTGFTLVGWNDLGMHCMDGADFSVFSLLPPFNNVRAQLVDSSGHLVTSPSGYAVTYEAVADPDGSINRTSIGKTNFWSYAAALFGVSLPPDTGLAGAAMPGRSNAPQAMAFDAEKRWFHADGVPITPYDDTGARNPYPLLRLIARDASGAAIASTDIVVPVSDEMSCRSCHVPPAGSADPLRDMRLDILRLHDARQGGTPAFQSALARAGYNPAGLAATVTQDATPILCARCHASNALPGTGVAGVPPLTQSMHAFHASASDPSTGQPLGAADNRTACYSCHPGSLTRCLRGAMGSAVAADGSLAIQCQGCHGSMSEVGAASRTGWLDMPACQNCHTGTAARNNGQIRYPSAFEATGQRRVPVDTTFATTPDVPAAGFSLYRASSGHGGLSCEACHGSTHAEYPSSHRNDNLQGLALQGHIGLIGDCATCHPTAPATSDGGPHGMHPVGADWVARHSDAAESGAAACQACHGTDYRGTVLSRALGDRSLDTRLGTKAFWRGFQIGCYTCHNGPSGGEGGNPNAAPVVTNAAAATPAQTPVSIGLVATDPNQDALTLRIVRQAEHGTVGLAARTATYYPDAGFYGVDTFSFAASDGSTDSNLATVTITVGGGIAPTPTPGPRGAVVVPGSRPSPIPLGPR